MHTGTSKSREYSCFENGATRVPTMVPDVLAAQTIPISEAEDGPIMASMPLAQGFQKMHVFHLG